MDEKSLSVVLHGQKDLRVEEMDLKPPKDNEVQLSVHSVGICGTDIHNWLNGYIALKEFTLTSPMRLGHETSGTVISLGKNVASLKIGDRVGLNPAVPCLRCDFCQEGKGNLCPKIPLSKISHGHFTRKCNHPADFCYKLPDFVSFEEGALLEPLSVGVYACERARVVPGASVLIIGGGTVGMMSFVAAKSAGASKILVADIYESKLTFAKKMGATCVHLIKSKDAKNEAAKITELLGEKADCTIECSGTESGIRIGIFSARSGSFVAMAGLAPEEANLPLKYASINEIDVITVFRSGTCFNRTFKLLASGQVDLKPFISSIYPLEKTPTAFEDIVKGQVTPEGVKVIVHCQD